MILDTIRAAGYYSDICPGMKPALEFLLNAVALRPCDGKYEIDGRRIYASIDTCEGKGRDNARLETHRKYIDLQFCLEGSDDIGWSPVRSAMVPAGGYIPKNDITFFSDAPRDWFTLSGDIFCILFPHDAHAPLGGTGKLRKLVIKISI
jgi:biofilm protein TabA